LTVRPGGRAAKPRGGRPGPVEPTAPGGRPQHLVRGRSSTAAVRNKPVARRATSARRGPSWHKFPQTPVYETASSPSTATSPTASLGAGDGARSVALLDRTVLGVQEVVVRVEARRLALGRCPVLSVALLKGPGPLVGDQPHELVAFPVHP